MKGIMSLNITLFTECMCCAFVMVFQTALFLTLYMLGSCFRTLAIILVSLLFYQSFDLDCTESVYYAGLYSQLHTGSNADLYIL